MLTALRSMYNRLAVFALIALAMRVATPAGFMIDTATDGESRWFTVTVCSATGSHTQRIRLGDGETAPLQGEAPPADEQTVHPECAFAAANLLAPPPASTLPEQPHSLSEAGRTPVFAAAAARRMAAPPPPATGPPARA